MLKRLHIQNYALISHLDIDFESGFSVMTGETGAGKSIILGALALVLGARADSKAITDGEEKCIIEAEFDEGIIRRELYANGKSRSFVDDSVVTLRTNLSRPTTALDTKRTQQPLKLCINCRTWPRKVSRMPTIFSIAISS